MSHHQSILRVPTGVGEAFYYSRDRDGGVVRRLGVWVTQSLMVAVRVWRSNTINTPQTFGVTSGTYQEFTFQSDERITTLHMFGRSAIGGSTGFRFTTTAGRTFAPRAGNSSGEGLPIDVASGICVGVTGRLNGEELTNFGFIFLLPIEQMRMTNLSYPTLDAQVAEGIQPLTVWDFREENHSQNVEKEWSNMGSFTTTESSSWAITEGMDVFASVSVSGRIPFIGSLEAGGGWELSESVTNENGREVSATTEWTRSGTVPPRHWLTFQVTTRRGTISLPYTATMEVTLNSGFLYSYPLHGIYSGIAYTRFDIITRSGSLDDRNHRSFVVDAASIYRPSDLTPTSTTSKKGGSIIIKALNATPAAGANHSLDSERLGFYTRTFMDQISRAKGSIPQELLYPSLAAIASGPLTHALIGVDNTINTIKEPSDDDGVMPTFEVDELIDDIPNATSINK